MTRWLTISVLLHLTVCWSDEPDPAPPLISVDKSDWPWWRGPNRNGVASSDQKPPMIWDEKTNVRWKTRIPGRGHSSATVVGNRVVLTTADHDRDQQIVICLNRDTGAEAWSTAVHHGGLPKSKDRKVSGNVKASFASCTAACDGHQIYANFLTNGVVYTTALTMSGDIVWQTKISDYVIHQGYGSSPAIYEDFVIVSADNKGGGAVVALNRATGQVAWKRDRPAKPNYPSPVILKIAGKDQLLLTGCDLVTSLNPRTGKKNWEIEGATTECVTSTVTDGERIFTSGGYPKNHISAVAADGSGKIEWENNVRTYVPSMIVKDDLLFAVLDAGVATCRLCSTGKELWKGRLGGTFSSSPVLVGNLIYVTNEDGMTTIIGASPDGFQKYQTNKLGESVFATPVICGSRIYMRVAQLENSKRQEYLYCLGK